MYSEGIYKRVNSASIQTTTSEPTKIGHIFRKSKNKFSKNVSNEKCAPKVIFFNEKKIFALF